MPGDQHWDNQFGPVGASDPLLSVGAVGAKVYVGGELLAASNTKANYVAGYDGTNWFALNNGVTGGSGFNVFALVPSGTNLYVGGLFTNADNSGAACIARWDGSNFWPLAGGSPNGYVLAIKISGTNFFVGGTFTTNGHAQVNCIARWDGANWKPLGSGVTGVLPFVTSLEYDGTNIYIGGSFNNASGVNATNVAYWNGSSWSPMGNGLGSSVGTSLFTSPVLALARYGGYLYAGGNFTNASLASLTWHGGTAPPGRLSEPAPIGPCEIC